MEKSYAKKAFSGKPIHALSAALIAITVMAGGAVLALNGVFDEFLAPYSDNPPEITEAPEYGNTAPNSNAGGYFAEKDGWVYYTNFDDGSSLYKMRQDGSDKTKLNNSRSYCINVVGDWVYYFESILVGDSHFGSLNKIRTDGTEETVISAENAYGIIVVDDRIYYSSNSGWYKINTDGTERTWLGGIAHYLNVADDWVYYTDIENHYIHKAHSDGTEEVVVIEESAYYLIVHDDWIYYTASDLHMYKIRTDGTEKTMLNHTGINIHIVGDWLYFIQDDDERNLYKMRFDGTEKTQLSDERIDIFLITGDWIYDLRYDYNNDIHIIHKSLLDGTQRQLVELL